MVPVGDGSEDGCYISKGYDATTHFETTVRDVLEMYKRITGKDLDLSEKELQGESETERHDTATRAIVHRSTCVVAYRFTSPRRVLL